MLAGPATVELINHLNSISNIILLESLADTHFDRLSWGIEAVEDNTGHAQLEPLVVLPVLV
jgi:hypothetical protein